MNKTNKLITRFSLHTIQTRSVATEYPFESLPADWAGIGGSP